ncbi:MAG: hypothetical protein ACTSUG_01135 [Candidatus Helarchaeota archaeon]
MKNKSKRVILIIPLIVATLLTFFNINIVIPISNANSTQKIIYIYNNDLIIANDYKNFLEMKGYSVSLLNMSNLVGTSLSSYDLIIIGSDTGYGYTWGTSDQRLVIRSTNKPIIGLCYGGASYFENISNNIGWGKTWSGTDDEIKTMDIPGLLYNSPNKFQIYTHYILYSKNVAMVSVYINANSSSITLIGREKLNNKHYPVIMENSTYVLWGFEEGPSNMTYNGTSLFNNIVYYLTYTPAINTTYIPGFELIPVIITTFTIILIISILRKRIIKKNNL